MPILKVCRLGHPVLRQQARPVAPEVLATPATQTFIDNMVETMIEYRGVGLAAPQVYESLSIAVIESHGPRGDIPLTVLVNPEVTFLGDELLDDWEGCLSISELRGRVPRHARLRVEALDRRGKRTQFEAEGFFARVVQHEFDHLMGRVYLDRMRDFTTLTHFDEFQRYWT
jgi:peptide deformylase